ncbi:ABC transporter permease [Bosea caraganae]|uniref:ABC transporter permease n=1 Tax=Bosea caraganae TaxID=2763117 RepID=A0A370L2F5_9HYPH|nr:ABC transporter permease [Bosea caraganae]RDJ21296.1 ABC transporter permease [Bosea caraganae]RDJ26436.1 ABC transporter permease [Bosea caraganae]
MTQAELQDQAASKQQRRSRAKLPDLRLLIGAIGVGIIVLLALVAPWIAPYDPNAQHLAARLRPPSAQYLLGTDHLGRDLLSRLLHGLRPSLVSGLAAVMFAGVLGTAIGVVAGYFRGVPDAIIGRVLDLLIAWPAIFIALALVLLLGPGPTGIVIAIGLSELPVFARVARAITLANTSLLHVEAAISIGASTPRIMIRHILPFAIPPLIVQFAIAAPQAVVAEASLSFLGLGTQPPDPSLGAMVSNALLYLSRSLYGALFPIAAIALLILCLTLFADGLQETLDPKRRMRRA